MSETSGLLCPVCGARLGTAATRRSRDRTALIRIRKCSKDPINHQWGSLEVVLGYGTRPGQMEELLPLVQLIATGGLREHYAEQRARIERERTGSAGIAQSGWGRRRVPLAEDSGDAEP